MNKDIVFPRSTFERCIESLNQDSGRIFLDTTLNVGQTHTKFLVNDIIISSRPPEARNGHYIFEMSQRRMRASKKRGTLYLQRDGDSYLFDGRFTDPKSGKVEVLDCIKVIGFPMMFINSGEIDLVQPIQREREVLGNAATMIGMLSCAIIGCGKTGFPIFKQLLDRVKEIVVVDYQRIEKENLAFLEADESFLGKLKVEYFQARAENLKSKTRVVPIFGNATNPEVLEQLKGVDVIFLACDRTLPRIAIALLGQQYFIPVIDVGVAVSPSERRIVMIGQVQVFLPGPRHGCISCLHGFNMAQALRESMSPFEMQLAKARGLGQEESSHAIKAFSSMVANQAVLEFNNLFSRFKEFHQFVRVDGLSENPVSYLPNRRADPECIVCGRQGILGAGDTQSLPDPYRGGMSFTIPEADGPSVRRTRARSQTQRTSTMRMASTTHHSSEGSDSFVSTIFYAFIALLSMASLATSIFGFSALIRWLLDLKISNFSLLLFSITASIVSVIIWLSIFSRRDEK
jgi:molybdopterin/thiamine biosynthesis adenylyltransferase